MRLAPSGWMALTDYLCAAGCNESDLARLGSNSVAWRGAVYRASVVPEDEAAGNPALASG
jgi:hypothetical protein